MSTRGPVNKPADLKVGHSKQAADAIEVAPVESHLIGAEPPEGMSPLACEVWRVCISDMAKLGHLREPDLLLLRGYSETAAVMIESAACIDQYGAMMQHPITAVDPQDGVEKVVGYTLKPNPAVKQHRESLNALRLLSAELALNPIARIRGNLMAAAATSIALGIKDELEAEIDAEDRAMLEARPTEKKPRKAAAKRPAKKKPAK